MKKVLLSALVIFGSINMASAKLKIPVCFPCETLETTLELPDDSEIQELSNQKLNVSYINKEYGVLWMSVWNTDGRFVLSDESNTTYFEIDNEIALYLKENHNFDIETAENPLSFWKKIGGKAIVLVLLLSFVWSKMRSKGETEE